MEAAANTAPYTSSERIRFIALSAGFVAGVLNAFVARLLMRGIALVAFGEGSFSLGGTAVIFMFGALAGPLLGLIYGFTLYKLRTRDVVKGLLFGIILLVTLQLLGLYVSPEFRAELMMIGPIGFVAFGAMNFAFVLTLAFFTPWLDKRWPSDGSARKAESIVSAIFGLLALAGLVLIAVEIGGRLLGVLE
jgi:hypothetical protein